MNQMKDMNRVTVTLILLFALFLTSTQIAKPGKADLGAITSENTNFSCNLKLVTPSGNATYVNTMPLNFTIDWSINDTIPWIAGLKVSYRIDNSSTHVIPTSASSLVFHGISQVVPTYSYDLLDIANLTNGKHQLNIFAEGSYDLDNDAILPFTASFATIFFDTENYPPTPTHTVPELSWLIILPLLLSVFSIAVVFRHRKLKSRNFD
jgi:hypothetical protein